MDPCFGGPRRTPRARRFGLSHHSSSDCGTSPLQHCFGLRNSIDESLRRVLGCSASCIRRCGLLHCILFRHPGIIRKPDSLDPFWNPSCPHGRCYGMAYLPPSFRHRSVLPVLFALRPDHFYSSDPVCDIETPSVQIVTLKLKSAAMRIRN